MAVNKYILPKNSKRKADRTLWEVQVRYKDFTGKMIQKHKRGFATMREAKEWEQHFKAKQGCMLVEMTFADFVDKYYENLDVDLRENTMRTKRYLIDLKILPYFGERKIMEINQSDIMEWQKEIKKKGYADTYLKTINSQLSAIFNYAVQMYDLPTNPCKKVKGMGKSKAKEMSIWTQEEFEQFLPYVSDKPYSRYGFLIFFWTGIRLGELLALTQEDFDLDKKTMRINKSCQYIKGRRIITEPKTERSNRTITLPDNLIDELKEFFSHLYGYQGNEPIFPVTKSYFENEMRRGATLAGIDKIRIHDLRHSHASLLISKLNVPVIAVSRRLGHENVSVTLNTYGHLYPTQMDDIASQLNMEMTKGESENAEET
jgi:integrase